MLRVYPAVITKAEGEDYGVVFPDLPGCVTTGETMGEAAVMAIEALAGHVGTMIEAEEALPEPARLDTPLPDWLADIAGKVVAAPVLVSQPIGADQHFTRRCIARTARSCRRGRK